mmetsp:Transcript_73070/g.128743  ORF Transcript_73070/g.128743 Transcript_73070/m.128743 type:complete len:308 (-) Transcript_73070:397-1320(-)
MRWCGRPCRRPAVRRRSASTQLSGSDLRDPKDIKVSLCIGVKDRLQVIRQTLAINLEATKGKNVEFAILDYNSSDGFHDWVREHLRPLVDTGLVVYHHESQAPIWHMSKVKNITHRLATGDVLVNLDADNYVTGDVIDKIQAEYARNPHCLVHGWSGQWKDGTCGRVCISREDLYRLGGYDETLDTYGFEEMDLIHRAFALGLEYVRIPWQASVYYTADEHPDRAGERVQIERNKYESSRKLQNSEFVANLKTGWGAVTVTKGLDSTELLVLPTVFPEDLQTDAKLTASNIILQFMTTSANTVAAAP